MIVPVAIGSMGIMNLLTTKMSEYLGVRILNLIAVSMFSGAFIVLSTTTSWNVTLYMFSLIGSAYGICFITTLNAGWTYYP